ncbi:hypothetical protein [Dactylosporangium sp. CS-033363]|uniref:hypothetical protein n=1 Tax=Dactylosporangium sp. CS-033363 TaxID=3239935 RepID=UPI003D8A9146
MAWRAAKSILALFEQLQLAAPRAVPPGTDPKSWGTVGNDLHDEKSDHTPHDFPGWGDNIVTAGDFPNVPGLGLDARKVLDDIRRARDPRAKYGISNDEIFSNHDADQDGKHYPAWTWRPYLPHDPDRDQHREHGHLSVVGDPRADGTQAWPTLGGPRAFDEEEEMGASFGPIQLEATQTSLTIPPVQAGLADPRKVWLNVGADSGNDAYALRIWGSNGEGNWFPVDTGGSRDGIHTLKSGVVLSIELAKGLRVLSVTRMPIEAGRPPYAGSISACFERA